MKVRIWFGIIFSCAILVGLGLFGSIGAATPSRAPVSPPPDHIMTVNAVAPKPPSVTLFYDNYGFDPNIVRVPVGTQIFVKNIATTGPLWFEALPNQPNQNTALNLGYVNPGQTKTFTITRPGVWQYEGNNNASIRGVIATTAVSSVQPSMYPDTRISGQTIDVRYDVYGFMPNEIRVPAGTTMVLSNVTDNTQPGPSRFEPASFQSSDSFLRVGMLNKQQSVLVKLITPGSWQLQDVYQPPAKGLMSITVY